jgi:hypothetical protein
LNQASRSAAIVTAWHQPVLTCQDLLVPRQAMFARLGSATPV